MPRHMVPLIATMATSMTSLPVFDLPRTSGESARNPTPRLTLRDRYRSLSSALVGSLRLHEADEVIERPWSHRV